jgi:ankyrin repeat protein
MLLKAGADVKAQDKNNGLTALMYAAETNQNPEVITTLLKSGADAKAKDNAGKTALDYAQDNENLKGTDAYRQLQEASQ